jgi:protein-ribulosamine 3-kinase
MTLSGNLKAVDAWLQAHLAAGITRFETVGGGCINETGVVWLASGERLFVKLHQGAPAGFFSAEAHGLEAIRANTDLKVPTVVHADREFLLLEDLGSGTPRAEFWSLLGTGLAQLHSTSYPTFGLERDNFCGSTPQRNSPAADGYAFFADNRLIVLAEQASQMGLLENSDLQRVFALAGDLRNLLPDQPAVLIHGDLWSGNVHCDKEGYPALIDPACYRGWAEAEMAMTLLFGGFHQDFHRAYEESSGIARDWRERAPLYNLYHLLNHLLLFGTGYLSQVRSVLDRYS